MLSAHAHRLMRTQANNYDGIPTKWHVSLHYFRRLPYKFQLILIASTLACGDREEASAGDCDNMTNERKMHLIHSIRSYCSPIPAQLGILISREYRRQSGLFKTGSPFYFFIFSVSSNQSKVEKWKVLLVFVSADTAPRFAWTRNAWINNMKYAMLRHACRTSICKSGMKMQGDELMKKNDISNIDRKMLFINSLQCDDIGIAKRKTLCYIVSLCGAMSTMTMAIHIHWQPSNSSALHRSRYLISINFHRQRIVLFFSISSSHCW